jgi:hypothetical protein
MVVVAREEACCSMAWLPRNLTKTGVFSSTALLSYTLCPYIRRRGHARWFLMVVMISSASIRSLIYLSPLGWLFSDVSLS